MTNHSYWNQSLWLANDEGLYHLVCDAVRTNRTKNEAARAIKDMLPERTPDDVRWSVSGIRAHLVGWTP